MTRTATEPASTARADQRKQIMSVVTTAFCSMQGGDHPIQTARRKAHVESDKRRRVRKNENPPATAQIPYADELRKPAKPAERARGGATVDLRIARQPSRGAGEHAGELASHGGDK